MSGDERNSFWGKSIKNDWLREPFPLSEMHQALQVTGWCTFELCQVVLLHTPNIIGPPK